MLFADSARGWLPAARHATAVKLVEGFCLLSGVACFVPVPFLDLAAVGEFLVQMIRRISQIYGVPFSESWGRALLAGLAGSTLPASGAIGLASAVKAAPAVGTAISAMMLPTLSAGASYAIGRAFIQHYHSGGTLADFNASEYQISDFKN